LARALVNRPALLLADEPTGSLDSATGESIMMMLLREIQQSPGMTVVMVTHERQVAQRFAGCIAAVQDSKLTSNGVKS
jgi:ABC-type methionine transport system ATPase subunit